MTEQNAVINFLKSHLKGAAEVIERDSAAAFLRLPIWTEPKHGHNPMVLDVSSLGSGVRLEFETTARTIEMTCGFERAIFPGMPRTSVKLVYEVDGIEHVAESMNVRYLNFPMFKSEEEFTFGDLTLNLGESASPKQVKIWFPHNATTLIQGFTLDGEVSPTNTGLPKWVHYGSSISQSGEAKLPTGVWPVVAAKRLNLDLVNLGLAGNAMLDPFIPEAILSHKPDVVSLKLGINSINGAAHTLRTFTPAVYGLIDALRAKQPDLKILLISPIICPPHEEGFGPTIFNMETVKATANPNPAAEMVPTHLNTKRVREVIHAIYQELAKSDANIFYFSGLDLLGEESAHFLDDDLHPNSEGYQLMGKRFAEHPKVQEWLGR